MNKITITNFKGIEGPLEINLSSQIDSSDETLNLILYSENGGGKTTISEAIRLMAFPVQIENKVIAAHIVDEERAAAKRDWLNGYLHDKSADSFEIEIDDAKFSDGTSIEGSNTFILGREHLVSSSKIKIHDILDGSFFSLPQTEIDLFSNEAINLVLDEVNEILRKEFKESIALHLPESGELIIGISGIIDGMITEDINNKLNEAQQNLIKILLFLNYIKLLPRPSENDKYLIILDDIVSSLDLANRIVLARIITNIGKDPNYQLLVMTHNVGFYNLMQHLIGIDNVTNKWLFKSMYKVDGKHIICVEDDKKSIDEILKQFDGKILPNNSMAINVLRKNFERLLHEFGKILSLGVQEETIDIISKISNIKSGYYCHIEGSKICTHNDLISNIITLINVCPQEQLQSKLKGLLKKYSDSNNMPWIADTIRHLHTFQKVILHQGSHDHQGVLPIISAKEITMTIDLMRRLENIISRGSSSYPYYM